MTHGMRGIRSRVLGALIAAVALSATLRPAMADIPGPPRVSLRARQSGPVAQGEAFRFLASLENTAFHELHLSVTFQLGPGGDGASGQAFRLWRVDVIPGGTATLAAFVVPAHWFAGIGSFEIVPLIHGRFAGDPLAFEVTAPMVTVPVFRDVTARSGLDTVLDPPRCGQWGSGAAWGDVDGDGSLDLYVPRRPGPAQLWINDGSGHFDDQAAIRGVSNGDSSGVGAVFADYDNDGDPDLYVVNIGANRLYRNEGDGTFTDVTPLAGVGDTGVGPSAAWGDYDADGLLDLYVVNHSTCQGGYQPDRLFHNEGHGSFSDQTALLGPVEQTLGAGFQAAWFDVDGDGDQDLYLANDYLGIGPDENHLWRNDGPGQDGAWRFTDVSAASGTNYAINSMGIGIADYDHDLDLDFAVSNIGATVLARNNGDGTFTDVANPAGVATPYQDALVQSVTWGLDFADLNLDGWEDLYVAAGPTGGITGQANELFAGAPGGRFLDLSAPSGANDRGVGRGVAFADYDRDGRVDLFVLNMSGRSRLLRNVTPRGNRHWLEVRAVGTASNRDGCGARLLLTAGETTLMREVFCGSTSLASGKDPYVHFGLGTGSTVDSLAIEWPSGATQRLGPLAADQQVLVSEPGGPRDLAEGRIGGFRYPTAR